HKVDPIEKTTAMQEHEERKSDYQVKLEERKKRQAEEDRQINTSSVKVEDNSYRRSQAPAAKNGDGAAFPSETEKVIVCGYCGAKNIVPRYNGGNRYSCYFCREQI